MTRILHVEDDTAVAKAIGSYIEYLGCEVVRAAGAADAVQHLGLGDFDACLTVWGRRELIGPSVVEAARALDVPVRVLSATPFRDAAFESIWIEKTDTTRLRAFIAELKS